MQRGIIIRLPYIDRLKGLAIYLVVLGHVVQHFYSDESFAVRFIYSFHMPLFMFMSGYVCYLKDSWNLVHKRAVQLLIPFFSYILLTYVINLIIGIEQRPILYVIWDVIVRPDHGLWFLWALFFINVIFIACRQLARMIKISEWIIMLTIGVLLNLIVIIFHFRQFGFHWIAWYFLYFYIGVAWRTWSKSKSYTNTIDHKLLVISIIVFSIMIGFFRMHNEPPMFYKWINLGPMFPFIYRFIIGIAGIAATYEMIKLYSSNNLIFNVLSKWGG